VSISSKNTVVKRVAESNEQADDPSYVMSSTPFEIGGTADFAEKKIKLVTRGGRFALTFGLAPAKMLSDPLLTTNNCGYHCTYNLKLRGESIENGEVPFKDGQMHEKSILQLRLHRDKTVSFVLDGVDLGVAFRDVNTAEPLYLVVAMWSKGDCVEFLL
jgi:hypothetical protein